MRNGPSAAAILAAGIGLAVTGIVSAAAEAISEWSAMLVWSKPVGALSGKTTIGIAAWLVSWLVLGLLWKDREVRFGQILVISAALLAVGLLLTFPPVFELIAGG
jgi:hypothetical protein